MSRSRWRTPDAFPSTEQRETWRKKSPASSKKSAGASARAASMWTWLRPAVGGETDRAAVAAAARRAQRSVDCLHHEDQELAARAQPVHARSVRSNCSPNGSMPRWSARRRLAAGIGAPARDHRAGRHSGNHDIAGRVREARRSGEGCGVRLDRCAGCDAAGTRTDRHLLAGAAGGARSPATRRCLQPAEWVTATHCSGVRARSARRLARHCVAHQPRACARATFLRRSTGGQRRGHGDLEEHSVKPARLSARRWTDDGTRRRHRGRWPCPTSRADRRTASDDRGEESRRSGEGAGRA